MVKDLLREIKGKLFQFIALTLITMLGVGFFVGIQVTGYDMRQTGDAYMEERSVLDFTLRHSLGIDEAMIQEVEALLEGSVEGVVDEDMFARSEKFDAILKVMAYTDVTKKDLTLIEGRLPNNALEVVIDHVMVELHGFEMYDKIKLVKNEIFDSTEVQIVGFVESSLFMNLERGQSRLGVGKVSGFLYGLDIPELSTDKVYTGIRIKDASSTDVIYDLEAQKAILSKNRFNRLIEPELVKLRDAQIELDNAHKTAKDEFLKAEKKFVAAEQKLNTARKELEFGINEISFLPVTSGTLDERLEYAYAGYVKAEQSVQMGIKLLESQIENAPNEEVRVYLQEQLETSTAELKQLTSGFTSGYKQLETGVAQYNAGVRELEANKVLFESEKKATLNKLANAQKEIDSGYLKIKNADHGTLYIQTRQDSIIGYREFYDDSNRIEKIGKVFPIIFFFVSILVTLSTVTRMVEENRMEMGVYKALGYSSLRTSMKYILFTGLSWAFGSALGLYFGFYIIPNIIYDTYRIMYQTPDMVAGIVFSYAYIPVGISFLSSVGVTFIKSMRVATEKTALLLRPVAPKGGQRIILEKIPMLWKRFSFLYKVSFRNLFRNKTRFLMTLLGIGGTTGLLIVGFGLSHSITSIVDIQFNEIIQYDGMVFYDGKAYPTDGFSDYQSVYIESSKIKGHEVTLYAADDLKHLNDFISMNDRKKHEPITFGKDDIIMTEKLAKLLKVKAGETTDILLNDLTINIKVDGIVENYAGHYIYISSKTFEQLTNSLPKENVVLFKTDVSDKDQLAASILGHEDVMAVQFLDEMAQSYRGMMQNFDIVIYLVIGAALALEVLVLTNLISMNMSERQKELATLKVLGFNKNELASYILRENIILTVISAVFGFVFGKLLHYFVITQAELDMLMFNYELKVSSYFYAFALTLGLSILINYVMARRANRVNMSEALKSFND